MTNVVLRGPPKNTQRKIPTLKSPKLAPLKQYHIMTVYLLIHQVLSTEDTLSRVNIMPDRPT
jgi:hypothetical protein